MNERRRMARGRQRMAVRFRNEVGEQRSAYTGNLSPGGVFVACTRPEKPGRHLRLDVDLPGVGTVELAGDVRWCRVVPPALQQVHQGGFGVRLLDAPPHWYRFFFELERSRTAAGV